MSLWCTKNNWFELCTYAIMFLYNELNYLLSINTIIIFVTYVLTRLIVQCGFTSTPQLYTHKTAWLAKQMHAGQFYPEKNSHKFIILSYFFRIIHIYCMTVFIILRSENKFDKKI
jgi:hypothetical protein